MSDVPEAAIAAAMAQLAKHRWKTMGVASVECECSEVVIDGDALTEFPTDHAFRLHLSAAIIEAAAPHIAAAHDVPPLIISVKGELSEAELANIRERFLAAIRADPEPKLLAPEPEFKAITDIVDEAIAAERERIAKLAEQRNARTCHPDSRLGEPFADLIRSEP